MYSWILIYLKYHRNAKKKLKVPNTVCFVLFSLLYLKSFYFSVLFLLVLSILIYQDWRIDYAKSSRNICNPYSLILNWLVKQEYALLDLLSMQYKLWWLGDTWRFLNLHLHKIQRIITLVSLLINELSPPYITEPILKRA